MSGIKITYSWGDEESLIECKRENAWEKMCELAGKEAYIASYEESCDIDIAYWCDALEINLHYQADDEYCYYRFVEEN